MKPGIKRPSAPRSRNRISTASGIITLLTDFGVRDAFVGIMKGVILGVNRHARLVDLSHDLEPQDVTAGALLLRSAVRYFPPGTVHLAVVDPEVGSSRRALAIATRHAFLVGPDNGLLQPAAEALGIERVHAIDAARLAARHAAPGPLSHTFHGRDVFAPAAALLSAGLAVSALGPAGRAPLGLQIPSCRASKSGIDGEVIHIDRFGNLITNIASADLARLASFRHPTRFRRTGLSVTIAAVKIHGLASAYAAVPHGALLAIMGSWDVIEIAMRGGNAARRLAVARGAPVRITT